MMTKFHSKITTLKATELNELVIREGDTVRVESSNNKYIVKCVQGCFIIAARWTLLGKIGAVIKRAWNGFASRLEKLKG